MEGAKKGYILSEKADKDIDAIFDYTAQSFGFNQAVLYVTEIENTIKQLLVNPQLGKTRSQLKEGLYSIPLGEHLIFYRILKTHIRVVRILHGSRDIPKFLIP